jgi:hypothetical protein
MIIDSRAVQLYVSICWMQTVLHRKIERVPTTFKEEVMADKEKSAGNDANANEREGATQQATHLGTPADTTTPGTTGMGSIGAGGTPSTTGGTMTSGSTNTGETASDHTTGMGGGPVGATTSGLDSNIKTGGGTTGLGYPPGTNSSTTSSGRAMGGTEDDNVADDYQP